jgi:hypothetical protein
LRLADWPRNPYLNDELREWVRLHLESLGTEDVAVYALTASGQDEERRVLVATGVGLLDSWYAPHGSTARFSLSVRLYPWTTVRGVDLRGETFRLWAHEHQSRWRLRLSHPALDTMADTPDLGRALAEFAATCSVLAAPVASGPSTTQPRVEDAVPAFLGRAGRGAQPETPRQHAAAPTTQSAPRSDGAVTRRTTPAAEVSAAEPAPDAPVHEAPRLLSAVTAGSASTIDDEVGELERRLGLRQPDA